MMIMALFIKGIDNSVVVGIKESRSETIIAS
jgi:hypothetical protein